MPENKLKNSTIKNIAVTRGLAFALVTAVYIYMDNTLSGYLWCVYVGFFLSMALGAKNGKMFNYILSALIGYGWAFLYVNLGGWLSSLLPLSLRLCIVIAEFVLTASLLFIHLKFLSNTKLNVIPAVFAAIATIYASGGYSAAPYCALSVVIGIVMAFATGRIISKLEEKG